MISMLCYLYLPNIQSYSRSILLLFILVLDPLLITRIISIAFGSMLEPIKCSEFPFVINLLPFNQSLSQVWVTDIKPTEADQISPVVSNCIDALLCVEGIIGNNETIEIWPQCFAYVLDLLGWGYLIVAF